MRRVRRRRAESEERGGGGYYNYSNGNSSDCVDGGDADADVTAAMMKNRNRSSSFSHASLVLRPRMVTTFSAEGGDMETSSTTITYQFFHAEDKDGNSIGGGTSIASSASSVNAPGGVVSSNNGNNCQTHNRPASNGRPPQQLAGFDLMTETNLLMNRTEQLFRRGEDEEVVI